MRSVSVLLLLVAAIMAGASATKEREFYDLDKAADYFDAFVKEHNREYKDEADRQVHFEAFKKSLDDINKLNAQGGSAAYGVNKFADYTPEERQTMFGYRKQ